MHPNKRTLSKQLRDLDKTLASKAQSNYCAMLARSLRHFPPEVQEEVGILLQNADPRPLLEWADSFGRAVHATAKLTYLASQLTSLIKKYPFPATGLKDQARNSAVDKFLAAEKRCKRYNLKFQGLLYRSWDRDAEILRRMSAWIAYVIGEKPDLMAIYSECSFGPGASIGVHGQNTNMARKLLSPKWSCTPSALPYAVSALAQDQHVWELLNPNMERPVCFDYAVFREEVTQKIQLVNNNNIVFVPKTTLVDRTIAVEPLLNGYVQKGTDIYMRRRLKRVGLDLSDQTRNQELARQGSLPDQNDPFVTIDLSSASDSIAIDVVRRLLPTDWFDFLNSLRSKYYKLDGPELHRYEKFTSMGNGFCFPLETLIFASVCAIYSKPLDFTVYGDDIIVRQSVAKQVIKTLWKLGFRHNPDKTFISGQFRESCGADWFAGRDVRPLTLDYTLDNIENVIKFFNMSLRKPEWVSFFEQEREFLFELIPRELRFCRPFGGVEYSAFEVSLDVFQSSSFSRWNRKIRAWEWMEIVRTAAPDEGVQRHERYSTALVMAAVRMNFSQCPFASRRKTLRTVRRMSHAGSTSLWVPPTLSLL